MKLQAKYKIAPKNIDYRIIDDEAIVLNLDDGNYYSLNKSATLVWKAIYDGKDINTALSVLKKAYSEKDKVFQKDISALIKRLLSVKLIIEIQPRLS